MPLQANIWLMLFGGLQALLLSVFILTRKNNRQGYIFFVAYLLVLIAQILFKVADKQWLIQGVPTTYFLSYKFPLLYGPLVWLFTKSRFTPANFFSLKESLHFIPFVYSVIILNVVAGSGKLSFLYFPLEGIPGLVLQLASISGYHFFAFREWKTKICDLKDHDPGIRVWSVQWVGKFISHSFVICTLICLLTYFIYISFPSYNWLRFGFLLLTFFIYWISYSALQYPSLPGERVFDIKKDPSQKVFMIPAMVVHGRERKYANSNLSDAEATRLAAALNHLMKHEELFREPALGIETLADRLSTNRYILSQVLNERLGQSFYVFINRWRIEAAKEMLADDAFAHHKIAAIGYEAGFNSLSTFNDIFKKLTGITPSQYRKNISTPHHQQRV